MRGDDGESVGGGEEHASQSPLSEDEEAAPFEWWRHTHCGQDWMLDIPLPYSEPGSPVGEAATDVPDPQTDNESYDLVSKYAPEEMTWRYHYESSFRRRAEELSFMAETMSRATGQAWAIPEDGRSGLTLSLRGLGLERLHYNKRAYLEGLKCNSNSPEVRRKILTTIGRLSDFDKQLHKSPDRSFSVIDFDPWNRKFTQFAFRNAIRNREERNNRRREHDREHGVFWDSVISLPNCWREIEWDDQKQPVMHMEQSWEPKNQKELFHPLCIHTARSTVQNRINSKAPWRRLIIVQGIASISHKASEGIGLPGCPYLDGRADFSPYVLSSSIFRKAVKIHLLGHNTSGNASSNPYRFDNPFHITFYERLNYSVDERDQSQWPIGELFSAEPGGNHANSKLLIRRSSFTVATIPYSYFIDSTKYTYRQDPFYTVLLLLPEGFMRNRKYLESSLCYHLCGIAFSAELSYIISGLGKVIDSWIALEEYIGNLLLEDFMDPKEYSALLFDDESFSRSRKYFWVIGSLNEFISSISDNIKQWDLYCQARLEPLLENPNYKRDIQAASLIPGGNDEDLKLIRDRAMTGANHRETLANIKSQFEKRLETVKALRDGLFNASALVESRAATRLGENVKLLTYVSIFYLPLAFCASLWAVPNVDSRSIRTPFIVTTIIVGFITYAIVFNLNTVTHQIEKVYHGRREGLVKDMQAQQGWWGKKGQLFEEFKPKDQKGTPSEWLVFGYAFRKLFWSGMKAEKGDCFGGVRWRRGKKEKKNYPRMTANDEMTESNESTWSFESIRSDEMTGWDRGRDEVTESNESMGSDESTGSDDITRRDRRRDETTESDESTGSDERARRNSRRSSMTESDEVPESDEEVMANQIGHEEVSSDTRNATVVERGVEIESTENTTPLSFLSSLLSSLRGRNKNKVKQAVEV